MSMVVDIFLYLCFITTCVYLLFLYHNLRGNNAPVVPGVFLVIPHGTVAHGSVARELEYTTGGGAYTHTPFLHLGAKYRNAPLCLFNAVVVIPAVKGT